MKIVSVVGTRPEIIKSSRIFAEFDKNFDHILINTNQNYDYNLNKIFFDSFHLREPDICLNIENKSTIPAIAELFVKVDRELSKIKPDAFYLLGDTNSGLSAICANKLKIPIFHMEAGNRCFNNLVPEETNRKIIDHISDINMVYTEFARTNLLTSGIHPSKIIKTGSPMFEVLSYYTYNISISEILDKLKLSVGNYIVFSIHREENLTDIRLSKIMNSIKLLISEFKIPIVFSIHPRTKKKIQLLDIDVNDEFLIKSNPFSFFDYISLQKNSFCVVSDSGSVQEESNILNFPAVTLRNEHERPEATEAGSIIKSSINGLIQNIKIARNIKNCISINDYNNFVSSNIVKIISGEIL